MRPHSPCWNDANVVEWPENYHRILNTPTNKSEVCTFNVANA